MAKQYYSSGKKSIDSGYVARDSERPQSAGPDDQDPQTPPQLNRPAPSSLVGSTVVTYSGANGDAVSTTPNGASHDLENSVFSQEDPSTYGGADFKAGRDRAALETPKSDPSSLFTNQKGVISQESAAKACSKTGFASNTGMPTLETAEDARDSSAAGVHFFEEETPNIEGLSMHVPSSDPQSQTASWLANTNSSGGANEVVRRPREEERPSNSMVTEMVGLHEQESSMQGMQSELAENQVTICTLQKKLESTTFEKGKVEQEYLVAKEHYEREIKEKNAEIGKLKDAVEDYRKRMSSLEKNNEIEREKYEEEICRIKEEMKDKEKEHERDILRLEKEVLRNELKISKMETQEKDLKCQLAEARLKISEDGKAKMEAEKQEMEAEKQEMERKNSILTERLNSFSSITSTQSE